MSIHYREIAVQDSAPSSPALGDIWIKPVGTPDTYQGYIWLTVWAPFVSGGNYIVEAGRDKHYINVVIQDSTPTDIIKPGWIWISNTLKQAYLYIFDFILLAGA